jgi:hypothetical protein
MTREEHASTAIHLLRPWSEFGYEHPDVTDHVAAQVHASLAIAEELAAIRRLLEPKPLSVHEVEIRPAVPR